MLCCSLSRGRGRSCTTERRISPPERARGREGEQHLISCTLCALLRRARASAVVELYQSWCGPCKAIISTFKRIYFDAGDRPLKFFTVRSGFCGRSGRGPGQAEGTLTRVRAHVFTPAQVDANQVPGFEEYAGKSQPVFLFYKVSRRDVAGRGWSWGVAAA